MTNQLFWPSYTAGTYYNKNKLSIKTQVKGAGGNWKAVRKALRKAYFRSLKLAQAVGAPVR